MKNDVRQAVIMAAGLGTRLRPLTFETPKPMLRVAGRPILEWNIEALPPDVSEVVIVVGHLKDKIIGHFGADWRGRRIVYAEQKHLLGTGHALHVCRGLLDERFLVMNGDDLYGAADIAAASGRGPAVLAKPSEVSGRFGVFRTDASGNLMDIAEGAGASSGALVNAGLYYLDRRFFDYPLVPIKGGKEYGLPQTLVLMAREVPVAVIKAGFWVPIGYPEDLEAATAAMEARLTDAERAVSRLGSHGGI